ncbi:hypothetical protein ACE6H2_000909 [Prunus campanulata]
MDLIDGIAQGLTRSLAISNAEAVEVVVLDDLDSLKATRFFLEVVSGSHASPIGTVRSHHVAFAAQKDISLGSDDTLHKVSEGSLSKKRRLTSDSAGERTHYVESDVTDVPHDVPVTISLGLSIEKEILGAQTIKPHIYGGANTPKCRAIADVNITHSTSSYVDIGNNFGMP